MTTYIERVITEVVVENEPQGEGEAIDQRWHAKHGVQAALKAQQTKAKRVQAEGLDD